MVFQHEPGVSGSHYGPSDPIKNPSQGKVNNYQASSIAQPSKISSTSKSYAGLSPELRIKILKYCDEPTLRSLKSAFPHFGNPKLYDEVMEAVHVKFPYIIDPKYLHKWARPFLPPSEEFMQKITVVEFRLDEGDKNSIDLAFKLMSD